MILNKPCTAGLQKLEDCNLRFLACCIISSRRERIKAQRQCRYEQKSWTQERCSDAPLMTVMRRDSYSHKQPPKHPCWNVSVCKPAARPAAQTQTFNELTEDLPWSTAGEAIGSFEVRHWIHIPIIQINTVTGSEHSYTSPFVNRH